MKGRPKIPLPPEGLVMFLDVLRTVLAQADRDGEIVLEINTPKGRAVLGYLDRDTMRPGDPEGSAAYRFVTQGPEVS